MTTNPHTPVTATEADHPILTPVIRLTKDVRNLLFGEGERKAVGVASQANASEARVLIDLYYSIQDYRKSIDNQCRSMDQGMDGGDSHQALDFMASQIDTMERNAVAFLQTYVTSHVMWPWLSAVDGIGPILAAGLVAYLGHRPVPATVGKWNRYAGLDPTQQWLKADQIKALWTTLDGSLEERTRVIAHRIGCDPETVLKNATINFSTGEIKPLTRDSAIKALSRIPFNRTLKTLCWKIGDQFVKLGDSQKAYYAKYYRQRKAQEIARNLNGERSDLARVTLKSKPTHAQRAVYAQGMLPDGRIDLMARRATVKLFLSHLHELWYRMENPGQLPPKHFAFGRLHHVDYLPPPHQHVLGLEPIQGN